MANIKTKYPKKANMMYLEKSLVDFARKESIKRGCFHDSVGSSSEFIRRGFKSWILKEMPYLAKTMKDVDWAEAY